MHLRKGAKRVFTKTAFYDLFTIAPPVILCTSAARYGKKSLGEDLWLIESVYGSANCVIGIFFSALYDGVFGFFVSFVVFVPNEIRWASSITSPN